jgi:tetratricopeptide (TPR) repeat protein
MAKRITFAVLVILIWPAVLRAQESIQAAQALYASASYDEALAVLDHLQKQPLPPPDVRDVQQNRALCLLALGRTDEAALAVAAVVSSDPGYRPSEAGTPPRVRAIFKDVRGRLLPGIIVARYGEARTAYDGQQWADAAKAFQLVISLAGDPDLSASDAKAVQDYRVLANGFVKLAEASAEAAEAAAKKAAEPPVAHPAPPEKPADAANATAGGPNVALAPSAPGALHASASAANAATADKPVAPNRLYSSVDAGVVPPVVIRQDVPKWSASYRPPSRDGILELTIGLDGRIERATLTQGMAPPYDHDLLEATRNWRYEPARMDGRPVRYRKAIRITFQ